MNLVCNKTSPASNRHLYKRSGHLVRTPIKRTLTLQPTGQFLYEVGDEYKQVIPTSDFFTQSGSGYYANIAGHHMRQSYLGTYTPSHDSSGWSQIWRNNNIFTLQNDSGYVFYNGGYSPAKGFAGGAAYMRIPAYKFTLPSGLSDYNWTVDSVTLTVKTHGIVIGSGSFGTVKTNSNQYPVLAKNANTTLLPANNDWREARPMDIGVFSISTLDSTPARTMYGQCQDEIEIPNATTDAANNGGTSGGNAYQLWNSWSGGQVVYNDGKIINAPTNPASANFTMSATFNQALASLIGDGTFCIAMIPDVGDSGGTGAPISGRDYPYYTGASFGQSNAWWLCERHLITQLQINLALE